MKKFILLATILSAILFCTSCTSMKTIVVNVQKPAQLLLPQRVNSIGIVNNAVPQPHSWGNVKYKKGSKKGEKNLEKILVSSDSGCYIFTESLYDGLIDLNVFDKVSLYEFPFRNDQNFLADTPLDSLSAIELNQIMGTDAFVSLDRLLINTVSFERPHAYTSNAIVKLLDLKMDVLLRLHSKEGRLISAPLYFSDSIYWESAYSRGEEGKLIPYGDSLPSTEDAIKQAAVYASEKIASAFGSSFIDEARVYYGDVKGANKQVEADNWAGALNLWEKAYETEQKPKKKARLASNVALAYELTDNIREAVKWAQIAVQLFTENAETSVDAAYLENANLYHNRLLERYNDFRMLELRGKKE